MKCPQAGANDITKWPAWGRCGANRAMGGEAGGLDVRGAVLGLPAGTLGPLKRLCRFSNAIVPARPGVRAPTVPFGPRHSLVEQPGEHRTPCGLGSCSTNASAREGSLSRERIYDVQSQPGEVPDVSRHECCASS